MPKTLNMMYNWIGPRGPITNTRVPNVLDITHNMFAVEHMSQGLEPLYKEFNQYSDVNLVTPEFLRKNRGPFVYELELLHTRVWDTNFKGGFGILENTFIPHYVYAAIRQKQGFFLLTTPLESFLDDQMLQHIHTYFKLHNIPLSQIIYLTNCINCKDVYQEFCEKYSITEFINCEYIGSWVNILVPECKNQSLQKPYVPGPRTKTFLKFNRRYRQQRVVFLMELYKRGVLDDFHISFMKEEPENHTTFLESARINRDMFQLKITDDEISSLNDRLPLVLDTPDLSVFPVEKSLDQTKRFYDDSLIHIIAETNFFGNIMHLTEKTLKPIMYKQPFIVVGPYNSLEYIRRLGFKTFSDIWDESYDTIKDDMARMYKTLDIIENISKKSDLEKLDISHRVKDIVEYNFQQMQNRKPVELYEFVERYGE